MAGTGSVGINFVTALPTTANVGAHRIHTSNGLLQGYNGTTWVQYGAGGGGAAISAGGNSVSSGTVVFSNSNGVSFGMSGSTITATVVPGAAAGIAAIGASSQTATSGTIVLSNSNGLTFGMSASTRITGSHDGIRSVSAGTTNVLGPSLVLSNSHNVSFGGNGSTITASASYSQSTSPAAIAANGSTITNGTVVFSNSNGVSFGANGSTVTASVAAGATATGNLGALAAGSQTATSGTVALANSNGLTFGMVGSSQITGSYTVPSTAGLISAINISAGTTSTNASALVFSNANGVTFGLNGATITASASGGGGGGGATISQFDPYANAVAVVGQVGQATMHFAPAYLPAAVQHDRFVFPVNFSGASNSRGSATISVSIGFFTKNASSISLVTSYSTSQGITHSGTASSSVNNGPRQMTMGATGTLTQNAYIVGIWSRTTNSSANVSISNFLCSQLNSSISGLLGVGSDATAQYPLGVGIYSVTFSTAMPSSFALSHIRGVSSAFRRPPLWWAVSGTA